MTSKSRNTLIAQIPIKAHLKKFALWMERYPQNDTIDLTSTGIVAYHLTHLLSGKSTLTLRKGSRLNENYNAHLSFKVNYRRLQAGKLYVDEQNVIAYNNFLHKLMHEVILVRIELNQTKKVNAKASIHEFMEELELYDVISFDALNKANYRLRTEKKIPLYRQPNRQTG